MSGSNTIDQRLQSIVNRIERLEDDRREIADAIKDVLLEAKSAGYETKIIRLLIAERRKAANAVAEEQALLDTYRAALGMLSDTPLGQAALAR